MRLKNFVALVVLLGVVGVSVAKPDENPHMTGALGLDLYYYRQNCPQAETIVRRITFRHVSRNPTLAAGLLRMYFHDCYVRGCDASVLLKSPNNDAERDAPPNLTLKGYEVVDAAKSALEKECPGVVSCADVLALVTRDAVLKIKGPWWPVPLGRRDGLISRFSEANLPSSSSDIITLKQKFLEKGLNTKDLVVLSGAHTIGVSSCGVISSRIYNYTGNGDHDPSMKPSYVRSLRKRCNASDAETIIDMDPCSAGKFDSHYFDIVAKKKGLFHSDSALLDDPETRLYVQKQVATRGASFARDFSKSMVKLGFLDILTGKDGEIRRKCAFVN